MSPTSTDGAGRATRPALSRARIVSTALELLDRDGLEKLTMRRLGAELGADPMAVYHYFPSKARLFDAVVESVYGGLEMPPATPGGTWRDDTLAYARSIRAALLRHPGALPVLATRPSTSPPVLSVIEHNATRLVDGGLEPGTALDVVNCVAYFVIGQALAQVGEPAGGPEETSAADVDLAPYPAMRAAFASGWEYDFDKQFDLMMGLLLDGLERRLAHI